MASVDLPAVAVSCTVPQAFALVEFPCGAFARVSARAASVAMDNGEQLGAATSSAGLNPPVKVFFPNQTREQCHFILPQSSLQPRPSVRSLWCSFCYMVLLR